MAEIDEPAVGKSRGATGHPGLDHLLSYPLLRAIFNRRSRRIGRGLGTIHSGKLTYEASSTPEPLTPLEEAVLIAVVGITGITMPDSPYADADGGQVLGTPNLFLRGRAASSPDNAQAAHFFMINDSGTYFLRRPTDLAESFRASDSLVPEQLLDLAERSKVKVLDKRLDVPRRFPGYMNRNRQISNVPGSTIFLPVIDMTRQYINAILYLLSQPDGQRPTFVDDWYFYRKAGTAKWVRSGFLNRDVPIPLGVVGTLRTHIEADLLVQNLLLTIQAMGLGGWVHASMPGPILLGDEEYRERFGRGLNFRYHKPERGFSSLKALWRWIRTPVTPLPAWRANPVGLDGVLQGTTPPYVSDMNAAVDDILASKYGSDGIYGKQPNLLEEVFQEGKAEIYLEEASHYSDEVIACAKDICNYIYNAYGRFPAHADAIHVPGVWVQAHTLDLGYYDALYKGGYTESHAKHTERWRAHHGTDT